MTAQYVEIGIRPDPKGGARTVKRSFDEIKRSAAEAERSAGRFGRVANDNFRTVARGASIAERGMASLTSVATRMVASFAALAGASLTFGQFISNTTEAERAQAQLASAIASTGGIAGQTLTSLNAHAAALQKLTVYGDEATNVAQGLLLTFTNIRGDTFDRTTEAVQDMATAMQTDLSSAAIQLGKALNDPAANLSALSRSGIQFSDAQEDVIKSLWESGRAAEAQGLILEELERQFGGSAEAARNTLGGALKSLGNAWGDLFELAGGATGTLRQAIESLITAIQNPSFGAFVQLVGTSLFNAMTVAARGVALVFDHLHDLYDLFRVFVAAKTISFLAAATGSFIQLARAIQVSGLAMALFSRASRFSVATLAVIGAIVAKATGTFDDLQRGLGSLYDQAAALLPEGFTDGIKSVVSQFKQLALGTDAAAGSFETYIRTADDAAGSFDTVTQAAGAAGQAIKDAAGSGNLWDDFRREAARAADQVREFWKGTVSGFIGDLRSGLEQGKSFWQSFADAALNALNRIIDRILNGLLDALFQSINFGGNLFSGGGGGQTYVQGGLNANGGVYSGPGISAFSNSIVSQPTLFAFAKGAGIMGESGKEAILPLSQTSDGRLGVSAINDNRRQAPPEMKVEIHNHGDAKGEVTQREDGSLRIDVKRMTSDAIADDIQNNGPVGRTLSGFGVKRINSIRRVRNA